MNKTGIDITSKRFGILEKKALKKVLELNKGETVYDLGSGQSFFSIVVSFLGRRVYAVDRNFENFTFFKLKLLKKLFGLKNLKVEKKDISKTNYRDFKDNISIVYSARFFHYLDFSDGKKLLKILGKKLKKEGKVFFSISGIGSDLAENYLGRKVVLEDRFFKIDNGLQERFHIKEKICLYSKDEIESLFSEFFEIEEIWESDFKNIFVVARKKKM